MRSLSPVVDALVRVQCFRLTARDDLNARVPAPELRARVERLERDTSKILARWDVGEVDEPTAARELADLLP